MNYFISAQKKKKNHIPKFLLGLYNEIEENIYNFFRFICFLVSKLVASQQ